VTTGATVTVAGFEGAEHLRETVTATVAPGESRVGGPATAWTWPRTATPGWTAGTGLPVGEAATIEVTGLPDGFDPAAIEVRAWRPGR
jgi:hypothetical protein